MKLNLDSLELELLQTGGVDNWEFYHESLENYQEAWGMGSKISDFTDSQTLSALEFGGVDNWTWYDESLGYFNQYKDYIQELPEGSNYLSFEEFSKIQEEKEALELAEVNRKREETKSQEAAKKKESDTSVKPGKIESVAVLKVIEKVTSETDDAKLQEIYYDFVKNSNILKQNAGFKKEFVESIQAECKPGGGGIVGARITYLNNIASRPKFKKFVKEYFENKAK